MSQEQQMEMQYKPQNNMVADPAASRDVEAQPVTAEKPKRTFLGMRGGGIILDLCACFICCECMEGCCNMVDDCCCC